MEPTTPPVHDQPLPPRPAPDPAPGQRPGAPGGFFESMRRIGVVRTQERWIGGVAGGLARRLGIDPLLVRGLLAVTVLLGGAGLVLYGVAWALLPEETDGRIHLQEMVQGRFDVAILGALAVLLVGVNRGGAWDGWWDGRGVGWVDGLLWAAVLAAVVAITVAAVNGRHRRRAAGLGAPSGAWAGVPPPPRGGSRGVPHPGYGTVPYASAAPGGAGWAASATPEAPGRTASGAAGGPGAAPAGAGPVPPPPGPTAAGSTVGASGAAGHPAQSPYASRSPYPPQDPYPQQDPYPWPAAGPAPWTGGDPSGRPPQPPVAPRPRRRRAPGPGRAMVGTVVGLTLLALAALLVLDRTGALGQPLVLTALGIAVVLAGLAILVSGLRGRRGGALSALAVVALLVSFPVAEETRGLPERFAPALTDGVIIDGVPGGAGPTEGGVWRPESRAEARRGLSVGLADVEVDLTGVPLGGGPLDVPIEMGAGEVEVVVPEDAAVTAEVSLAAGEVRWAVDGGSATTRITGGDTELYRSDEAADGDVELAIRITAGAVDVRVVEED